VIVRFDGKEIKQMRDLPRAVAETPAGKQVIVLIIRNGKEGLSRSAAWRTERWVRLRAAVGSGRT
jgi:serine protease Do